MFCILYTHFKGHEMVLATKCTFLMSLLTANKPIFAHIHAFTPNIPPNVHQTRKVDERRGACVHKCLNEIENFGKTTYFAKLLM